MLACHYGPHVGLDITVTRLCSIQVLSEFRRVVVPNTFSGAGFKELSSDERSVSISSCLRRIVSDLCRFPLDAFKCCLLRFVLGASAARFTGEFISPERDRGFPP